MRATTFVKKKKAGNNTGRATEVTSIMISKNLKEYLSLYKEAYSTTFGKSVTYDQMLSRWMNNVGRFDPDVKKAFEVKREVTVSTSQETLSSSQTHPQIKINDIWERDYYFEKEDTRICANVGDRAPFYAVIDGAFIGMKKMLAEGWILIDSEGKQVVTMEEAQEINRNIRENIKNNNSHGNIQ